VSKTAIIVTLLAVGASVSAASVSAQELSPEEAAARKAADPLGNVKAVMTDNTIAFKAGEDENDTSFGFQIQPVYAIPNKTRLNMIARAVVPIVGIEAGAVAPPIGSQPRPEDASKWGAGDSLVQFFFSPKTDGSLKWGIGPQVSLKTHTSDRAAGAGWGGGLAGVVFGASGQWSYGAIAMQLWGEDNFSIFTLQPIAIYLLKSVPGAYIGYNNSLTYNWKADSDDAWAVPLGLTFGKAVVFESGDFMDLSVGAYPLVVRPAGAPSWQLKLGISYFFN
jgi:hypothetical protein